ncbi:MAG: hypothetical protein DRH20_07930 [Deltaproteobacteria bacterium]|nr:MAG: hypothetical protein DRH20_07930 [Deltaproteobacteria bacterium]
MAFKRGKRVVVHKKSRDESWQPYMDRFLGAHGIVTDPDATKNDPDALIEVTLDGEGTHRFPQDCLRLLEK